MPTYDLRDDAPRYIAEALKITGQKWITASDLALGYDLPRPNNLADIKAEIRHDTGAPAGDEYDVTEQLIYDALERICRDNPNAVENSEDYESYRLADGVDADTLQIDGAKLIRGRTLPDLFTPETGLWADNIRSFSPEGLTELRQSMEQFGWNPFFPAIRDENGVIIAGHRRLAVAEELGIKPLIKDHTFGEGEAADAKRAEVALVSNIGVEKISPADRKKIAEDLYGTGKWSMPQIGNLLKVSAMTISRDLSGFNNVKRDPSRGGRPRKGKVTPEPTPPTPPTPEPESPPAPGGLTEDTPGQTDRVAAVLEHARAAAEATPAPQMGDDHEDLDLVAHDEEDEVVRVGAMIGQIGRDIDTLADLIATMDPATKRRVLEEHHVELNALNGEKMRRLFNEVQGKKTRKRAAKRAPAAKPAPADVDTDAAIHAVAQQVAQDLSGLFQTQDAAS
jgi:hypothetical protein